MYVNHRCRVVKFFGGPLALLGADINEFLGGYDINWEGRGAKPPANYTYDVNNKEVLYN